MQKREETILIIPKQIFQDPELIALPIEKLFLCPLNERYVKAQIKFLCDKTIDVDDMMQKQVLQGDPAFFDKRNKFVVLSDINEKFIKMVAELLEYNDDQLQRGNWEYTEYSMRGGTWHPEDLFLESESNRKHAQWNELNVEFNPWKPGIGNPYMTKDNPYPFPAWRFNPRYLQEFENNGEDRRVAINRKLGY
jgi:hypothetical protein